MSERHKILDDERFWLTLEFGLSGWFSTCGDKSRRGFWCDGFIPHSARNTKQGVEVTGDAWIAAGRGAQYKCSFTACIPQRMLTRRRAGFVVTELTLDLDRKTLELAVAPASKQQNTALERTSEE